MSSLETEADLRDAPRLNQIFTSAAIIDLDPDVSKATAIAALVRHVAAVGAVAPEHVVELTQSLVDRERYGTTGLGKGLALPHLRSAHVPHFAGAVGVARQGIDFGSLDGAPTRLVILLLSPFDARVAHAELMGRLATLLNDPMLQYVLQVPRSRESLLRLLDL